MSSTRSVQERYKLIFFVPALDLEKVRSSIFATGAGTVGDYTEVCFSTPGVGRFKPAAGAKPHVGEAGKVQEVGEVRCEIQCHGKDQAKQAVEALKRYCLRIPNLERFV